MKRKKKMKSEAKQISYDFFKLPIELQDWFLNNGVQPMTQEGANSTVGSYLTHFRPSQFTVKLKTALHCKDGLVKNEITVNKDSIYTAFLPEVWTTLDLEQKMQVIVLAYNNILFNDKTLKHNPPALAFFDESNTDYYATYNSKDNIVTLKLSKMLFMKDGFDIPSLIAHELTHAKQKLEKDKLLESKKPIKEMSAREVAIVFESTDAYMSSFDFFYDNNIEFLKQTMQGFCGITEKDIDLIKDNQKSPDALWTAIFKLPYLSHPMEIEAYRTQNYFRNKMIDSLSEEYEVREQKHSDEFKRVVDELNSKTNSRCGYNITEKTLENLGKLNYALGSTVGKKSLYGNETTIIVCSGMKTMIN